MTGSIRVGPLLWGHDKVDFSRRGCICTCCKITIVAGVDYASVDDYVSVVDNDRLHASNTINVFCCTAAIVCR